MADLAYPAQPCGLPYRDFKSGWLYKDAYEHVAYGRGEGPRTITQRTVLRQMSRLKKDEYQRYKDDCAIGSREAPEGEDEGVYAEEGDTSFDFNGLAGRLRKRGRALADAGKQCTVKGRIRTCVSGHLAEIAYIPDDWRGGEADTLSGERVSQIVLQVDTLQPCRLQVGFVEVSLSHLGKGIGTKLYEAAAQFAARQGCQLISDRDRSPFAEAFWRKQERKGRASCDRTRRSYGGHAYMDPLIAVTAKCIDGSLSREHCAKILRDLPKPEGKVWPCPVWALNFPPPDSLAGVRRRRKKGRR